MTDSPQRVAILGGGYAGMAAAVTLADAGVPVTVFEAGLVTGGRARRVEINGVALDNGLHILIGAYRETLRLIAKVHPAPEQTLLRLPLDWHVHERMHLRAPRLPAPLHLAAALATARGVGLNERWQAIVMMRALRRMKFQLMHDTTVSALLAQHDQGEALTQWLWHPLCVAALNTPPARASAQMFLNVLRDTFTGARADSDMLIPRVDLSRLFPEPAADYVHARGGTVLTGCRVTALQLEAGGLRIVAGDNAGSFSHVVCALPPHLVAGLLEPHAVLRDTVQRVAALTYQPITSVYFQFDGTLRLPAPMLGLADATAHWLFDREAICGQRGLVGAVISAEGAYQSLTQDQLAQRVLQELGARFGPLPPVKWQRVISEKRASFSAVPDLRRPAQRTALPGLWLAGDYTAGEYPATLEAAVRSGLACARGILNR